MSVTMLLCFMGATLGWSISWQLYVDSTLLAYLSGATAQQLYDQLLATEFSQAGAIFKAVSSATVTAEGINAEAFARCSYPSTAYWAQIPNQVASHTFWAALNRMARHSLENSRI